MGLFDKLFRKNKEISWMYDLELYKIQVLKPTSKGWL